jgi:membrane-associated phospholipid phosphatase
MIRSMISAIPGAQILRGGDGTARFAGLGRLSALVLFFLLAAWGMCRWEGLDLTWLPLMLPSVLFSHYVVVYLVAGPMILLTAELASEAAGMMKNRPARRAVPVAIGFIREYYTPANIARGLIVYLVFGLTLVAYLNVKPLIPLINPRLYDGALWRTDRLISGPGLVWLITELHNGPLTRVLDAVYFQMFNLVGLTVAALYRSPRLTWRFASAMPLAFALSVPVSILAPSLGPAFVKPEMFSFLDGSTSSDVMANLWSRYQSFKSDPAHTPIVIANGIVAMPSLHITMVFLSVVFLQKVAPRLKWILWGFLGLFFLSTVYLGWHYIADGIAGIALGWVVLLIGGRWFPDEEMKEAS